MQSSIAEQLEEARKELLDLGLRNPLINFRTLKSRGVRIVDERPTEIHRILVEEGKPMTFLTTEESVGSADIPEAPPGDADSPSVPGPRHVDNKLRTPYDQSALEKRLLNTYYTARTSIEEQGVSVLYLALGMLEWFEASTSDQPRRAPLVLVPVELDRKSVRAGFRVSYTDEEVGGNLSLRAKLHLDFGVRIPDLPENSDTLDLSGYFRAVEKAIDGKDRWQVDREAVELGFFSFGKFLMFNDLDADHWPEEASPADHPVIGSLLGDEGFSEPTTLIREGDHLDEHLAPDDVHHVVDADSTQILAMLDALAGNNLVIQGPPGTGKSQTITNLIAEALGKGWKVLFVSEKMAALEVVKRRLDGLSLGDACVELHSHKTNKRDLLAELKRTLNLGKPRVGDYMGEVALLADARSRLNKYVDALHTPVGESGLVPFALHGHLSGMAREVEHELPFLSLPGMREWTRGEFEQRYAVTERLQARIAEMGVPQEHPFRGSRLTLVLPTDLPGLKRQADESSEATNNLAAKSTELAQGLQLPIPLGSEDARLLCRAARRALEAPDLEGIDLSPAVWEASQKQVDALLGEGKRLSKVQGKYDDLFIPEAWAHDVLGVRQAFAAHGSKWWRFLLGDFRRAKAELAGLCRKVAPKDPQAGLAAVDAILEVQRLSRSIGAMEDEGKRLFGVQWQGPASDWPVLERITVWVQSVHQEIEKGEIPRGLLDFLSGGSALEPMKPLMGEVEAALETHESLAGAFAKRLDIDSAVRFGNEKPFEMQTFEGQEELYRSCEAEMERIHQVTAYNHAVTECRDLRLDELLELADRWDLAGELLALTIKYNWYRELTTLAHEGRPELAGFNGAGHRETVRRFRELDEATFEHNRARLAQAHWEGLPSRAMGVGQLGVLQAQFEKKRRHLPIRRLVERAGNAIQAIKPVFMMSPMSIATYLPPGSVTFDLVVFDEASQVKPVEAFGAILRAQQAVVVGDSKQLPPTSFFDKVTGGMEEDEEGDDDGVPVGDLESILSLFNARGAPERMLRWHYRSRHDSLIAVSNREFYDNRLVTFPSPLKIGEELGVRYHYLGHTHYDRGRSRTNRKEARVVAEAVTRHAREVPGLTLGVAAFSQAQAEAVQDEVERLRREDPGCERFFAAHPEEPFFIKNIENVQGDERDVILISVGYGRDLNGKVMMNFGPLNKDGGERRLNVLITRARRRCEVFTNLTAEDIRVTPTTPRGVVALRRYLKFAETGEMEVPQATGGDADSPFETAVAKALHDHGHLVDHQVGSAGFRVDLGIVDPDRPGRYIIGIECDGASYHSARSARDRDRIRQGVLENLGWRLHRIWSTDWFRNPDGELRKALEAIERAKVVEGPSPVTPMPAAPEVRPEMPVAPSVEREEKLPPEVTEDPVGASAPYEVVVLQPRELKGAGIHEEPVASLAGLLREVVSGESPVHFEDAARRIMDAYSVKRLGGRVRGRLNEAVHFAGQRGWVRLDGDFLSDPDQQEVPIRDRSDFDPNVKKLERVAPSEIDAAVERVVRHAHGATAEEIPSAVCTLLGFARVTMDMRTIVDRRVEALLASERLQLQAGHLVMAEP